MADQFDLAVAADIAGQRTAWRTVLSPETGQFTDRSLTAHTALNGLVTSSRRFLTTKSVYDSLRRNLNKCWAQLEAKVTPTSDDLLTSNLFYSRTTIVRNMKFEFEGILIIISI